MNVLVDDPSLQVRYCCLRGGFGRLTVRFPLTDEYESRVANAFRGLIVVKSKTSSRVSKSRRPRPVLITQEGSDV